jgi:hypothetical protein
MVKMKKTLIGIICLIVFCIILQGFALAGMLGGRSKGADIIGIPTGASLFEQLKGMDYKHKFRIWPGKTSFSKGAESHGDFLTTYVNIPAFMTVAGKKGIMPVGAMIVTESYTTDKKLVDIAVMFKVNGYNPDSGDWFWARYSPDGKVISEGKVDTCIKCHGTKKDNDFILTGTLK